jgi:hypothetical protein
VITPWEVAQTSLGGLRADAWEADSWCLPVGVRKVSGRPDRLTLQVEGRKVPVVGLLKQDDHGQLSFVPQSRARREADRVLLDAVAELVGLTATIPRAGRPRGGGIEERTAQWVANRPEDMPLGERVRQAAAARQCDAATVLREYRRWRRDQSTAEHTQQSDTVA